MGPRDIFRNPEAIFRIFEGPGQMFEKVGAGFANVVDADASPFDLHLGMRGSDFAVMGMHFKIGVYEHQSAGAIQAIVSLLDKAPHLIDDPEGAGLKKIKIIAYEPAFGIIGDPAKRDPRTRQSADHSMCYIIATLLRKALGCRQMNHQPTWKELMLSPDDYGKDALFNDQTRKIMERIEFEHGGEEYDKRYPDGIPTSVVIADADDNEFDSGLIMYPAGHARNQTTDLQDLLQAKWAMLGRMVQEDSAGVVERFSNLESKSGDEIQRINELDLTISGAFDLMTNVCVFCAARDGDSPEIIRITREFGVSPRAPGTRTGLRWRQFGADGRSCRRLSGHGWTSGGRDSAVDGRQGTCASERDRDARCAIDGRAEDQDDGVGGGVLRAAGRHWYTR